MGSSEPIYSDSYSSSYPVESYEGSYPIEGSVTEGGYPVESYDSGYPVEGGVIEGGATDGGVIEGGAIQTAPLESAQAAEGAIIVRLPVEAKLFVNGRPTTSTGVQRRFVSKGLKSGYEYPYDVKATMEVNGNEVVLTKNVTLEAGATNQLTFDFDVPVETNLTVRLPEDAKLTIAGATTRSIGAERNFATTRLTKGETWSNYTVVVSVERGGRTITKEQTIELQGGDERTLTFDFDVQQVASR